MDHPLAQPRSAVIIGVVFGLIALVYLVLSHDAGGTTMLGALGIAMSLVAYVLAAGSPRG